MPRMTQPSSISWLPVGRLAVGALGAFEGRAPYCSYYAAAAGLGSGWFRPG